LGLVTSKAFKISGKVEPSVEKLTSTTGPIIWVILPIFAIVYAEMN
jgi:hypothetical protein